VQQRQAYVGQKRPLNGTQQPQQQQGAVTHPTHPGAPGDEQKVKRSRQDEAALLARVRGPLSNLAERGTMGLDALLSLMRRGTMGRAWAAGRSPPSRWCMGLPRRPGAVAQAWGGPVRAHPPLVRPPCPRVATPLSSLSPSPLNPPPPEHGHVPAGDL
jgi:hypothetical protein